MESNNTYNRVLLKMQTDYPNEWPQYIRKAARNIKAAQRELKLTYIPGEMRDAVAHCMKITDGPATAAAYVAAAGILTRLHNLESEHIAAETRALNIELQQEQLIKSKNFLDKDKEIINAYYTHCLAKVMVITDRVMQEAITLTRSLGLAEPQPEPLTTMPTYTHHHSSRWGGRGGAVSA